MFYLQLFYKKIYFSCTTILGMFSLILNNIECSNFVRFNGMPILKRKPKSYIFINKGCVFNSSQNSNLVGTNRRCVIATHRAKARIEIGINCGFSGTVLGAFENIKIGNNVLCGANTLITDSDWHGVLPEKRNVNYANTAPVIINDNVWLGINVVVLKGVTIGMNSVIGANSVVVKSIPPNVIAGGNPCKVIKEISC